MVACGCVEDWRPSGPLYYSRSPSVYPSIIHMKYAAILRQMQ